MFSELSFRRFQKIFGKYSREVIRHYYTIETYVSTWIAPNIRYSHEAQLPQTATQTTTPQTVGNEYNRLEERTNRGGL